ncbi:hypothetical protein GOC68_29395 [Sinorhizobium medicae]|nr:hypothetical protein [Sinorhizobium medicae]
MNWLGVFARVPALAFTTPVAVVVAILISAIFGYRLEIASIGLRFDKDPAGISVEEKGTSPGVHQ